MQVSFRNQDNYYSKYLRYKAESLATVELRSNDVGIIAITEQVKT